MDKRANFASWGIIASLIFASILSLLVLVALPIRTFFFQPFQTPSGSMMPTLLVGDHFFVSKYSYGYTRYSLPFSAPLFSGRCSRPNRSAATWWCSGCQRAIPLTSSNGSSVCPETAYR
jgi:signal peptidase I